MLVNGFMLPDSFVKLCQEIREGKAEGDWLAKGKADAYGNPRINSDIEFLSDPAKIEEETNRLSRRFREGRFQSDPRDAASPGFVEVTGVDKFVWFGTVGSGEPYCFDFGENPRAPSIVTWNDAYWQRIAPNFEAFIRLFAPWSEQEEAWLAGEHESD